MRHAQEKALDALEPILQEIRKLPGLTEKKRGSFYRKSNGFLHFHEDPAGFFADLKIGREFARYPVNNDHEIAKFLREAARAIKTAK